MLTRRHGYALVLGAYIAWGVLPLYWELLSTVPPATVLLHRVIWSVAVMALVLWRERKLASVWQVVGNKAHTRSILLSAALLGSNWYVYLWALQRNEYVAASLGYFICPLVSIALGALVCREKLAAPHRWALGFMAAGVALRTVAQGQLPMIALVLAATFSSYCLVRKRSQIDPSAALFWEMVLVAVVLSLQALLVDGGREFWQTLRGPKAVLLLGTGVITVFPLLAFVHGARFVTMRFLGWAQYLAPTLMLALAVFVQGHSVPPGSLASFVLIWIGIALMIAGRSAVQAAQQALRKCVTSRQGTAPGGCSVVKEV